jgi:hypothetical protein
MSELDVLAEKYPKWEPLVENWDKLIFAFENGLPFYELLEKIRKGDTSGTENN